MEYEGIGADFDSVRRLPALATHAGDITARNLRELDTPYSFLLPH